MKPLILGIGNILLGDEGIGVYTVQALEKDPCFAPHFDLVDGGTCGMELLDVMAKREHIIVVDAVLAGKSAGEIIVLHDDQVPVFFARKISPHQLGLCDVLSALQLTEEFPRHLCLIGVQPQSLAAQIGLSDSLRAVLPQVCRCVADQLQQYGFQTHYQ